MTLRQAVVVIHGMGSQRPRATVFDAARASISPRVDYPDIPTLISRPDKMTHGFDARRYMAQDEVPRLQTEFYEYHWAHMMRGNELAQVMPLVKRVMLRRPWKLPWKIFVFWALLWGLVAAAGVVAWFLRDAVDTFDIPVVLEALGVVGVWGFLATQVVKRIGGFATASFVDFARYTDPAPENQDVRDRIRRGAVDLLEALHEADRYDRVIIVAHSQGSVIAHDAITHLWARLNKQHARLDAPAHDALQQLEAAGEQLRAATEVIGPDGRTADRRDADPKLVDEYRRLQREAWVEYRRNGNPWLITDLVTLGSPMAHAGILMGKSYPALFESQARLESTTCPPRVNPPSIRDRTDWLREATEKGETLTSEHISAREAEHPYTWDSHGTRVYFHAAPFALTRWTALYYPADWFAGPLTRSFGAGIENIELKPDGFRAKVPVWAHTQYFHYHEGNRAGAPVAGGSVQTLRRELGLDSGEWLISRRDVPQVDSSTGAATGEADRARQPLPSGVVEALGSIVREEQARRAGGDSTGTTVLLAGGTRTDRLLAAGILSEYVAKDVYRIDLSQVVSKYVGETEKNLGRVFEAVEASGPLLLFDEADALFGKRADVKESHDRHANLESAYLLQRIETYAGIVVLATNRRSDLDPAFMRRVRFVVEFPPPEPETRPNPWKGIL